VASSFGFSQWFYDRLVPWVNHVPVAADMTDLLDIIDWLRRHDETARVIGQNGAALARSMDYASELILADRVVEAALRRTAAA
jgi:hypothetical protein